MVTRFSSKTTKQKNTKKKVASEATTNEKQITSVLASLVACRVAWQGEQVSQGERMKIKVKTASTFSPPTEVSYKDATWWTAPTQLHSRRMSLAETTTAA